MRTLREIRAAQVRKERAAQQARKQALRDFAEDIAAFVPPEGVAVNADMTPEARALIAQNVRKGRLGRPLDAACDWCKFRLTDADPTFLLMSCPPKIRVTCFGCGWTGFAPATARGASA